MLCKIVLLCVLTFAVYAREKTLPANDCANIDSRICHNFNEARMNAINQQINKELEASYVYLAMATYFDRDDPNYKGFAKFFYENSKEEREHAIKLAEYQNLRGGKVKYTSIKAPSKHEWASGLEALEEALVLEKEVNKSILKLHELGENDPHMQDFLDTHYVHEQVESIHKLSSHISKLKRMRMENPVLGEAMFDEKLN